MVLEASWQQVEAIVDKHASVAELAENGWLQLFALEAAEGKTWKYLVHSTWADFKAQS